MTTPAKDLETEKLEFEKDKFSKEYALKEKQIRLDEKKERMSAWKNPLYLTLLAAMVGLIGNAWLSYSNNKNQMEIEDRRAEAARILEVLKTGNPDIAAENLGFLLKAGLIKHDTEKIRAYLDSRKPGEGAQLAAASPSGSLESGWSLNATNISKSQKFVNKYPQNSTGKKLQTFSRRGYAFAYDTEKKLPLWTLYALSDKMLADARSSDHKRVDHWQYDPLISRDLQLGLEFYQRSGFDRGKMVSTRDIIADDTTQTEINLFSVCIPIFSATNRKVWVYFLKKSDSLAILHSDRELIVISGPVFDESSTQYKDVAIPGKLFRIVADPKKKTFLASWLIPNVAKPEEVDFDSYAVSIAEIEKLTGLKFGNVLNE